MPNPVSGAAAAALLAVAWAVTAVRAAGEADLVKVGAGAYSRVRPAGEKAPGNKDGKPIGPKVSARFRKPATSNDWWSSLIWQHDEANPHSGNLYPHPLALRAQAEGLGISYPTRPEFTPRSYMYPFAQDLVAGVEGLKAAATRVDDYSDWTVTASWEEGPRLLTATIGHGLPYAYFTLKGGKAAIGWPEKAAVSAWAKGAALGLTVNGHHYGVFAPQGSAWEQGPRGFTSSLSGKDFFSVAVLPDSAAETLELFRRHAFAFVTDTRVAWAYDGRVRATFTLATDLKEKGGGNSDLPLVALYRHQWLNCEAPYLRHTYVSPRGAMKLLEASSFTVVLPFAGVLPILPAAAKEGSGDFKAGKLKAYIKEAYKGAELFPKGLEGSRDTYWEGKSLLRNVSLMRMADQIGYTDARDGLLKAVKEKLESWLDGREPGYFAYDSAWRTLIGYPSVYRSGWEMNDHHFHNGYFIIAAAAVAEYDPAWAADSRWGGMIDLLVRDPANWDRADSRFPFLRYFDVYAGHSWANGPAFFPEGNNEESSSEDILFSTSLILWGAATGKPAIRDLGVFLHASQTAAIDQYWFDADREVFPKGYAHSLAAIVWGAGVKYDTWWSQNPSYIHGINYMPFTGGSLYLGRRPERLIQASEQLEKENRGPVRLWRDIHWMALALGNADKALEYWKQNPHYDPEWGHTRAMTYHWLHQLAALGRPDFSVTAAWPLHAVFVKNPATPGSDRPGDGVKTYVGANPTSQPMRISFSDGFELELPPRSVVSRPAGAAASTARKP